MVSHVACKPEYGASSDNVIWCLMLEDASEQGNWQRSGFCLSRYFSCLVGNSRTSGNDATRASISYRYPHHVTYYFVESKPNLIGSHKLWLTR